jgi:hypothetical protein
MDKKTPLNEELKRHMQLLEYTFYGMNEKDKEDDEDLNGELLFDGSLNEQDPVPGDEPVEDPFGGTEEPAAEEPATDEPAPEGEEAPAVEDPTMGEPAAEDDIFGGEEGMEIEDEFADEAPMGGEESVEIDVTDIVDKTDQTKEEVAGLTSKMDELMGKLGDLEQHVTGMDSIIDKIDELETEIERRNPTPVERLEMRSMDSFPYSVKLTDFWADKEGYETGAETEDKEFVLTQQDVDEYSETDIKNSFDLKPEDEEENEF